LFSGSQGLERPIRCSSVRTIAFGTDGIPSFGGSDCLVAVGPAALVRLDRLAAGDHRRLLRSVNAKSVA
jgi:hypothetical protein